jgi:hypothetical protein
MVANPDTGGYSHGSASRDPYTGGYKRSAPGYNPYTGRSASGNASHRGIRHALEHLLPMMPEPVDGFTPGSCCPRSSVSRPWPSCPAFAFFRAGVPAFLVHGCSPGQVKKIGPEHVAPGLCSVSERAHL